MQVTKEVVSVSEMARMVALSRARFYQLMTEGVFPTSSRQEGETGRPFFDREQQEQCLKVRRTNQGMNGQAVLFYSVRAQPTVIRPGRTPPRESRRTSRSMRGQTNRDATMVELRQGLSQLGLPDVPDRAIRTALVEAFPDGHDDVDRAELLRVVFGRLNRQDSHDNLAG